MVHKQAIHKSNVLPEGAVGKLVFVWIITLLCSLALCPGLCLSRLL